MKRIPMLLAIALLAAACGQKGDLYLPEDERQVISRVPVPPPLATPATEEDRDEDAAAAPAGTR